MAQEFKITIPNFLGGYCPAWYTDTYPVYGNKNMAGAMANVNLTNPSKISQGLYPNKVTNGDENDSVTTLIKKVLDRSITDISFAVGGNQFYEIAIGAVNKKASNPTLPHTITAAHDIVDSVGIEYYKSKIYYSYYTSAAGDIGRYDLTRDAEADFDDDWATISGSATISKSVPLPLLAAGNDILYLGNKSNVSSWNNSSWVDDALDLPTDATICDLVWASNRLFIASNRPINTLYKKGYASIYIWDGTSSSWEDEIVIPGRVGALFVKDGIVFVFYETASATTAGKYKLGYITGNSIKELATFTGDIPNHGQVCAYKNFIIFSGGNTKVYAYGSIEPSIPPMLFQIGEPFYTTSMGALSNPFGQFPFIASHDASTGYHLARYDETYYEVDANWKSIMFPIGTAMIKKVIVYYEQPTGIARVDVKITYDRGRATKTLGSITETGMSRKSFDCGIKVTNDFRIELDWTNGSGTYPLNINRIEIIGEYVEQP